MIHPESVAGAALFGAAWVWAHLAFRRPLDRPARARALAFAAGLLAGLLALNGRVHDLAETSHFSAHMLQHLLLMLVVPPCLLAGTPAWMMDELLGVLLRRPRALRVARALTRPVPALAVYAAVLVVWHLPGPYGVALEAEAWHLVEHAAMTASAVLAWWPVLGPSRLVPPLPYAGQILYLFVFGAPMTVVAAMITAATAPIYPFYAAAAGAHGVDALADQRLGGVLMWVPAGIVPLVAFTIVFFRWAAADADEVAATAALPNEAPRRSQA